MSSLRRAVALSSVTQYGALLVQIVSTLIIARLLNPEEIGIFSVGASVVAVAHTLRDLGVTNYLIQAKAATARQIGAALGITMLAAWSVAAVLFLAAAPAANYYREPGVAEVLRVSAISFLLIPFGSIALAMLRRNMNFLAISHITLSSALVHGLTSVGLAHAGFGFMSLAWANLAGTACTVVAAAWLTPKGSRALPTLRGVREVMAFGSRASIASLATEVGYSAPDLIIGRMLNLEAVGMFSRAMGFVMLFERAVTDIVNAVALPYFSAEHRAGTDLSSQYAKAIAIITVTAWPCLGFLGLMAEPLIGILYGDQWGGAVLPAQILVVAIGIRCANPITGAIVLARGDVRRLMITQIALQTAKIGLIVIGASGGLAMVAYCLIIAELFGALLFARVIAQHLTFGATDYLRSTGRSFTVTVACLGPVIALSSTSGFASLAAPLRVGAALCIAGAVWLFAIFLVRHPIAGETRRLLGAALRIGRK